MPLSWEKHPLREGDRVIDDNGEFGTVYQLTSMTTEADGSLFEWSARIRYDYNMPSYGKTRSVSNGEVSKILEDGSQIDL